MQVLILYRDFPAAGLENIFATASSCVDLQQAVPLDRWDVDVWCANTRIPSAVSERILLSHEAVQNQTLHQVMPLKEVVLWRLIIQSD